MGVKGGGCSGMTYVLEYDVKENADEEFEVEGIPVILNKGHEMYLVGMEIEFEGGLNSTLTSSTYGALVLIGV